MSGFARAPCSVTRCTCPAVNFFAWDKSEFLVPVVGEAAKREGNGMRRMRLHIHARPAIAQRASWHQYLTMLAQSPWQALWRIAVLGLTGNGFTFSKRASLSDLRISSRCFPCAACDGLQCVSVSGVPSERVRLSELG